MIFNLYAFINLAGFITAICFLVTLLRTVKKRKVKILIFHIYLSAALAVLFEFIAESLSLKYYNTIIFFIDMELFTATFSATFLIFLIFEITDTKIHKVWYFIILSPAIIILFCAIFFPGKYIITGIKLIPTGYFGEYGSVVKTTNIIFGISAFSIVIILLLQNIKKATDILCKRRLQYIVMGIIIFLFFTLVFGMLQTIFKIYYLSVGGFNLYIIFLGFLCFIFINRNLSDINTFIRSKILYTIMHTILISFFIFVIILLKNIWNNFIKDDTPVTFSIFIIFAVIYLFPFYNKFVIMINKLLYKTPISLTESSQIFLKLLEEARNLEDLREKLWGWFEENSPVESIVFWSINEKKIIPVKRFGEMSQELRVRSQNSRLLTPDSRLITHNSRLYFAIKEKDKTVEIIEIINFRNKRFTKQELKTLEIILLYYEIFYINITLMQKLVMRGKIELMRKLSKNFKHILAKTKESIKKILDELGVESQESGVGGQESRVGSEKLKARIIKRLNKIIGEMIQCLSAQVSDHLNT